MHSQQQLRRKFTRHGRASRACGRCRARKVRCDVVRRGTTCTNCEIDQVCFSRHKLRRLASSQTKITCVDDNLRRKHLKYRSPGIFFNGTMLTSDHSEPETDNYFEEAAIASPDGPTVAYTSTARSIDGDHMVASPTIAIERPGVNTTPRIQHGAHQSDDKNGPPAELDPTFPRNLYLAETPETTCSQGSSFTRTAPPQAPHNLEQLTPISNQTHRSRGSISVTDTQLVFEVPQFVRDMSQRLASDDFLFLKSKGVWDIPPLPILSSAIQAFADYIYPSLPLVDLFAELETLASNGRSGKISLMLLYAIVLPGIPFMDSAKVEEAGYVSNRDFSKKIYTSIKVATTLSRFVHLLSMAHTDASSFYTISTTSRIG